MPAHDETDIADLLRLLPPAPERWVAEAKELPRTRHELDRVLPTLGQQEEEETPSREDFDHDDRLVTSAPSGRGNDDVEGHMNENESEKRPSGLDEEDVEGHSHRSGRHTIAHSEEKRPSGLDEDFDDDVEGHMHESEKRVSGKRVSGLDEGSEDEDV